MWVRLAVDHGTEIDDLGVNSDRPGELSATAAEAMVGTWDSGLWWRLERARFFGWGLGAARASEAQRMEAKVMRLYK